MATSFVCKTYNHLEEITDPHVNRGEISVAGKDDSLGPPTRTRGSRASLENFSNINLVDNVKFRTLLLQRDNGR